MENRDLVVEHGQESRFFLLNKHWQLQEVFKNVHEMAVAEQMGELLATFITCGRPQPYTSPLANMLDKVPIVRDIYCISSKLDTGRGPHYFDLTSIHPKTELNKTEKIIVNVEKKSEWLSSRVVDRWCKFFRAHGQTPFTADGRNF